MERTFGQYHLLDRLAVTAEVFRARARVGGREELVVLKKILPQRAEAPRFQKLFEREARLIASLCHDNIVCLRVKVTLPVCTCR